ncbi:DUF1850 domain-containing protein [Paracoccus spongiarum]|uniref:DUF1850 domain-containing protein n=1 Tax=Paracoccus spongiarum TaxID=3064387 RepID=A0ABT9JE10_9RHOB|nr:DUF1850 domain-containing protein [Paracoccus sp. 2205BS29-5]MDP5308066.1 DUF1850 domain-containing protein [Paracoccus sp. 2205BS29-5]
MSACLLAGMVVLALSGPEFRLEWTHSVERQTWRETWRIDEDGLMRLTRAAVKGSGAGMEPGPGAVLEDGWWVWSPALPAQTSLLLAASGATGQGWRLCDAARCHDLGRTASAPIRLRPCP